MIDEPLIVPISPGSALVRLCQVIGGLTRNPDILGALPADTAAGLESCRQDLARALEAGLPGGIAVALQDAQNLLLKLYRTVTRQADRKPEHLAALGFPDEGDGELAKVAIATVIPSFALRGRQVVTALSFEPAAGALGYRLYEVRDLRGEALEDPIVESTAPEFRRVRLAVGPHRMRVESHNSSACRFSDHFDIDIPALGRS